MRLLKTSLCIILILSLCAPAVFADSSEVSDINGRISTEYYSEDIYEEYAVPAATIPVTGVPDINAKSVVLAEVSTGKVLYKNNADESLSPASITKIMTMLIICEKLDSGEMTLNDVVTTTDYAASMGGSQIWLEPGETMTVEQLLKAVAVGSANDASVALAEHIAGSEEAFVAIMNARAKDLGMKKTTFLNACGLDADGHMTSAMDVALMSMALLKHDVIKKFSTIWMDSLRNGETQLVNTNKLVRYYMGATGLKTGTTSKAGSCLAASAKRENMELVAIVMGAETSNDRFSGAKKLLDYGFANWTLEKPEFDESQIKSIDVSMGQQNSVGIEMEAIKAELLSNSEKGSITTELKLSDSIEAPVDAQAQVGTLFIKLNDKVINQYKITTINGVNRIDWSFSITNLIASLLKP